MKIPRWRLKAWPHWEFFGEPEHPRPISEKELEYANSLIETYGSETEQVRIDGLNVIRQQMAGRNIGQPGMIEGSVLRRKAEKFEDAFLWALNRSRRGDDVLYAMRVLAVNIRNNHENQIQIHRSAH